MATEDGPRLVPFRRSHRRVLPRGQALHRRGARKVAMRPGTRLSGHRGSTQRTRGSGSALESGDVSSCPCGSTTPNAMFNALVEGVGEAGLADGTGCTDPPSHFDTDAIDGEEDSRWVLSAASGCDPGRIRRGVLGGHRLQGGSFGRRRGRVREVGVPRGIPAPRGTPTGDVR